MSGSIAPSVALLKEIGLLNKFSDGELQKVLQQGQTKMFEAHTNIVIEGELSWGLYIILEGQVGVYKTNKLSGNLYDVAHLRSGNYFGEMSLVDENPRSATVRALTSCQCFFLSKESFMKFVGTSAELKARFYDNCIQDLIRRLRELDDNYVVSQYQLWKAALKKKEVA